MRIAICVSNHHPMHFPAGVAGAASPLIFSRYQIAHELAKRGHEVTLYCSEDTEVGEGVKKISEGAYSAWYVREHNPEIKLTHEYGFLGDTRLLSAMYRDANAGMYDVILASNPILGMPYMAFATVPTLFTLHDPLSLSHFQHLKAFEKYPNHWYASISNSQRLPLPDLRYKTTIYHALKVEEVPFSTEPEDYLVYFGRIEAEKGVLQTIAVAKKAGMKLKIIGNHLEKGPAGDYWRLVEKEIDGKQIQYLGRLDKQPLYDVVKKAKAFLNMIQWEEPFGMTLIESMACGTPVVAMRHGAIPEVVIDGKTGYIVDSEEAAVAALQRVDTLSRTDCRNHVVEHFNFPHYIDQYERALREVVENYAK